MTPFFPAIASLYRASHQAFPTGQQGSVTRRLRFMLKSWPNRKLSLPWFELLETDEFMRKLAAYDHRVYRKFHHPYLSTTWDNARVLAVLKANYALFREQFTRPNLAKVFLSNLYELAEWESIRTYQLRMAHDKRFYREGEITISLHCPALGCGELASISGTVAPDNAGTLTFYIGGLQGAVCELGAAAVEEVGRDLHGLRPKSLVVIAAQMLARRLGCRQILATCMDSHAYSADKHRQTKSMFNYDSFWERCMGVRQSEAFYSIPLSTARRSREAMQPQKRPMYQRRYAMIDRIESTVERTRI